MTRLNLLLLFIGRKGTGKTTTALKLAIASGKKIIIVDTNNHPDFAHVEIVDLEKLKTWNGKICRVINHRPDEVFLYLNQYQSNAFIICEDAAKYISANVSRAVKDFIIDMRKRNFDVAFMFHFLSDVPPYVRKQYDKMILFKTGDPLQKKQDYSNWHTIQKKLEKILKHKSYNYCETIAIDE